MNSEPWEIVTVVPDTLSAQALLGLFASEGIRARVQTDSELLGAARRCHVLVPSKAIGRARCLLWQTRFSDEELSALAMGEASSEALGEALDEALREAHERG